MLVRRPAEKVLVINPVAHEAEPLFFVKNKCWLILKARQPLFGALGRNQVVRGILMMLVILFHNFQVLTVPLLSERPRVFHLLGRQLHDHRAALRALKVIDPDVRRLRMPKIEVATF